MYIYHTYNTCKDYKYNIKNTINHAVTPITIAESTNRLTYKDALTFGDDALTFGDDALTDGDDALIFGDDALVYKDGDDAFIYGDGDDD